MAQSKAAHIGECQCCCRRQMLPKGRLAKHGYQVAGYGFFNGVCWAAGELPYEVSCDFIKDTVLPRLRTELQSLNEFKTRLLEPATEAKGYHSVYNPHFGYSWKKVDVIEEEGAIYLSYEEQRTIYAEKKLQKHRTFRYTWIHGTTVQEVVDCMNAHYANGEVAKNIQFIEDQITRQERRVAEWKLTDLEPVKKVA